MIVYVDGVAREVRASVRSLRRALGVRRGVAIALEVQAGATPEGPWEDGLVLVGAREAWKFEDGQRFRTLGFYEAAPLLGASLSLEGLDHQDWLRELEAEVRKPGEFEPVDLYARDDEEDDAADWWKP